MRLGSISFAKSIAPLDRSYSMFRQLANLVILQQRERMNLSTKFEQVGIQSLHLRKRASRVSVGKNAHQWLEPTGYP
jgi:hypothetical protein